MQETTPEKRLLKDSQQAKKPMKDNIIHISLKMGNATQAAVGPQCQGNYNGRTPGVIIEETFKQPVTLVKKESRPNPKALLWLFSGELRFCGHNHHPNKMLYTLLNSGYPREDIRAPLEPSRTKRGPQFYSGIPSCRTTHLSKINITIGRYQL